MANYNNMNGAHRLVADPSIAMQSDYVGKSNEYINNNKLYDHPVKYCWQEIKIIKKTNGDLIETLNNILSMAVALCNPEGTVFAVHDGNFLVPAVLTEVYDITKFPPLGAAECGRLYHLPSVDKYYICSKNPKETLTANHSRILTRTIYQPGDEIFVSGLNALYTSSNGAEIELEPGEILTTELPSEEGPFVIEIKALNTIMPTNLDVNCTFTIPQYYWQSILLAEPYTDVESAKTSLMTIKSLAYAKINSGSTSAMFLSPNKSRAYETNSIENVSTLPVASKECVGKMYLWNGTYYILTTSDTSASISLSQLQFISKTTNYYAGQALFFHNQRYAKFALSDGAAAVIVSINGSSGTQAPNMLNRSCAIYAYTAATVNAVPLSQTVSTFVVIWQKLMSWGDAPKKATPALAKEYLLEQYRTNRNYAMQLLVVPAVMETGFRYMWGRFCDGNTDNLKYIKKADYNDAPTISIGSAPPENYFNDTIYTNSGTGDRYIVRARDVF